MHTAIIKDNVCINIADFNNIDTAQQFLSDGAFGDADLVLELPDGCGIGDSFVSGEWIKKEPVSRAHAEEPQPAERQIDEITSLQIGWLEHEYKLMLLELGV